jgi:putative NADH-flavin reductase
MRIVVIGASKGIGAALLDQAWSAGHHVVAVGRGVSVGERGNVTPIQGSILDPGVAERAVADADGVAWCVGNRQLGPAALRKVTLFSEGTRRTIDAMKAAGVRRLVVVTGLGAGESRGHGGLLYDRIALPFLLGAIYADKNRQEALVRASGLDWTIVRPVPLTDGPRTGDYRVLTDLTGVTAKGRISRADCADSLLRALTEGVWMRQAVLIEPAG